MSGLIARPVLFEAVRKPELISSPSHSDYVSHLLVGCRSLSSLLKPKLQAGQHGIAYARLSGVFTHGHYTPRNVAVGDHANWI